MMGRQISSSFHVVEERNYLLLQLMFISLNIFIPGSVQAEERSLTIISEQDDNSPTGRLTIMENIDSEIVPNLKAIFKKTEEIWEFELEEKVIPMKTLGTPIWVDDSYLGFDSVFSRGKNWEYFCISKIMGSAPPAAQNFHNNYLIYKLDGMWQGLYFYTPLNCKNSVSAEANSLKIKYTLIKPSAYQVEQRQLIIFNDGKSNDKLLATHIDKQAPRLKKSLH